MVLTVMDVKDVYFGYGDDEILKGVSISLDGPGLVCILGPNGVGKTTFVKCLNKLLKPSSGTVTIDGMDIKGMSLLDLARLMAFVPNSSSSVFSISVAEMILMGRHPHAGWRITDEDMDLVDHVIDALDLQNYADRDVREISAGQLQRVMIARGLAQEPKILILDEPTSNLDVKYQMDVMRFLKRYAREEGVIVIMVCHDLNVTAAYADRVVLMQDGRIFADGGVAEVLTEENIKQVYDVEARVIEIEGTTHIVLLPNTDMEIVK